VLLLLLTAHPATADRTIVSRTSRIDGIDLHYLQAGTGTSLILLHGYTQTSRMWKPIIPLFARNRLVIAPDLPGIGDSAIPREIDVEAAAVRIHHLAESLGIQHASVVGHDIGLMVAYAYAAQFPAEVDKLVLMDAFLPGVAGWEKAYDDAHLWHFRFNGPTPEALVKGRERTYFDYFWNVFAADKTRSIPDADREAYTAAYSRPGRMRAGWAYFASWPHVAAGFAALAAKKLTIPVLVIGGEKSMGNLLAEQAKEVAGNVTTVILKDTGHWVLEERPKETTDALVKFLSRGEN
jgi:pimeloyl-ACP methyl ester carboxylesterase